MIRLNLVGMAFALVAAWTSPGWAGDRVGPAVVPDAPVSFSRQVLPILQRKCQGCHQPAKAGGKLILTSYEALKAGGESGAAIEPGKPDESMLVENISGDPP